MKSLKQLFILILILALSLCFVACQSNDEQTDETVVNNNNETLTEEEPLPHEHIFSAEWSHDENYHWHACTVKNCKAVKTKTAHIYACKNCTACDFENPSWEYTYKAEDEANLILNGVITSDIHTDGNWFRDRIDILQNTYSGIAKNSTPYDAFICTGDLTNSGSNMEYFNMKRLKNNYIYAKNLIPTIGNHDSWHGDSDAPEGFTEAKTLFLDYLNFCNIDSYGNTYYSKVVNGITFIAIGTEDKIDGMYISNAQQDWLASTLNTAKQSNKPIFVLGHYPMDYMGEQSAIVRQIVEDNASDYSYPLFYISGHWHDDENANSLSCRNNVYYLDMPSTLYSNDGGEGYILEIYEHKILLKGRNFVQDAWIEASTFTINY